MLMNEINSMATASDGEHRASLDEIEIKLINLGLKSIKNESNSIDQSSQTESSIATTNDLSQSPSTPNQIEVCFV